LLPTPTPQGTPQGMSYFFNSRRIFSTPPRIILTNRYGRNAFNGPDRPQLHRVDRNRDPLEDLQLQPQEREGQRHHDHQPRVVVTYLLDRDVIWPRSHVEQTGDRNTDDVDD